MKYSTILMLFFLTGCQSCVVTVDGKYYWNVPWLKTSREYLQSDDYRKYNGMFKESPRRNTPGTHSYVRNSGATPAFVKPDSAEYDLHELINQYRVSRGLSPIKLSKSLTHVAQIHVADLDRNNPGWNCNMHSWSADGAWSECCYTWDHANASCMIDKLRELTAYTGNGYECAAQSGGGIPPKTALWMWQNSPDHNAMVINLGGWSSYSWKCIGVGIKGEYAVIWFGDREDPDGYWE